MIQGWPSLLTNRPENTNLGEDVKYLLPAKFHHIAFKSGCRWEELDIVSGNQRLGWPCLLMDQPDKHKLGRWRKVIVSCQVLSNLFQWMQRRNQKCEKLMTGRRTTNSYCNSAFGSGALKSLGLCAFQYHTVHIGTLNASYTCTSSCSRFSIRKLHAVHVGLQHAWGVISIHVHLPNH